MGYHPSNYHYDPYVGRKLLAGVLAFVLILVMIELSGLHIFVTDSPPPKRPPENKPAKLNGNAGD